MRPTPPRPPCAHGFTVIEALALLIILLMLSSLVLPALATSRRSSRQIQNATQLRGIHQGLVILAQTNQGFYAGLNADGTPDNLAVEHRLGLLLDNYAFTGAYLINPYESGKTEWVPATSGPPSPVTTNHYSYAMLQVSGTGGRLAEWYETVNADAAVLSDRNAGTVAAPTSVFSHGAQIRSQGFSCTNNSHTPSYNGWAGSVVFNDNATRFQTTHLLPETRYGQGGLNQDDHLFDAPTEDDALMVYSGN